MYSAFCSLSVGALTGAVGGFGCKNFCGSARNFVAHPCPQKKYVVPSCSRLTAAFAGSTVIPHTGSFILPPSSDGSLQQRMGLS